MKNLQRGEVHTYLIVISNPRNINEPSDKSNMVAMDAKLQRNY